MKYNKLFISTACIALILSCKNDDDYTTTPPLNTEVNFQYKTTINIGGEGASEISAFDAISKKLYTVNVESNQISVNNISNLDSPLVEPAID